MNDKKRNVYVKTPDDVRTAINSARPGDKIICEERYLYPLAIKLHDERWPDGYDVYIV